MGKLSLKMFMKGCKKFQKILMSFDTLPSLKDSNVSPKWKITKEQGVGAHSLAHNILKG
jgi:hypothetical protein